MRIGIITDSRAQNGYGRYGADTYKKVAEHGYYGTDFNLCNTETVPYTLSREDAEAFLLREREMTRAAGVTIWQVHGPWRFPPQDFTPEDRAERMEKMKWALWACSVLECKNYVIHPLMPYGMDDLGGEYEKETWNINLAFMRELVAEAKKYGITVCLENMPMTRFSIATPEAILRFVKTIDEENFRICLDTGHVAVYQKNLDLAGETRRLGKYIRVLHVHDNFLGRDMHLAPYSGIIDWPSFAEALKDIGFDGVFSLECGAPGKLSDALFEKAARLYADIAAEIVREL